MAAAYDKFNYPEYWHGRDYEHWAEVYALKQLLLKVPKIKNLADIGAGYGRLSPYYVHRAKNIFLVDPSSKLLKLARENLGDNLDKIETIHSSFKNFSKKTRRKFDLILFVRVMHHIEDIDRIFLNFNKLLNDGGYLIIEFPNKIHSKAILKKFLRGDITYFGDIFPEDKRGEESQKRGDIPFYNYHPEIVLEMIENANFEIIEVRSVSNVRSRRVKRNVPLDALMWLERRLQLPLAKVFFGPSIFVLAKKKSK